MGIFDSSLPFQVEEWSGDGGKLYRTLANCSRFDMAMAVYEIMMAETVATPRVIMIRNRARVVKVSGPEKGADA
jgi:hypothetical protein